MGFSLGSLGGVISSGIDYFSAKDTQKRQKKMAREQMSFQERMSNTAYQRAMADMRKAGLNPMLAYMQGGASSPAGAQAQMVTPTPGRGAMEALGTASKIKLQRQQEQLAGANTATAKETANYTKQQARIQRTRANWYAKNPNLAPAAETMGGLAAGATSAKGIFESLKNTFRKR